MFRALTTALLAAGAGTAYASPRDAATFSDVPSVARSGNASNAVRSVSVLAGYDAGKLRIEGTLTAPAGSTPASDARLLVTAPSGRSWTVQPFRSGAFSGSVTLDPAMDVILQPAEPAAGLWTVEFFESRDDIAGPDAVWQTISLTFDDEPPPPTPGDHTGAEDLGEIIPGSPIIDIEPDWAVYPCVKWYRFTLSSPATDASGLWLDLDSNNSEYGPAADPITDTEIALFDASGALIAQDDDDGAGLASLLSFGAVSPRPGGALSQDGPLAPGVYYLCLAPFSAVFSPEFGVSTTGTGYPGRLRLRVESGFATPPSAPPATDLGTLNAGSTLPPTAPLGPGEVLWYTFSLAGDAAAPLATFLDADTEGSTLAPSSDTVIGLYDATGHRLITDDDDGSARLSQLTFGSGSTTPADPDASPFDGRDGMLTAGTYYIAVSGFGNTSFGPAGWSVYSEHSRTGVVSLRLFTNTGVIACRADFNGDGFLDFFDYDDYVNCFETSTCPPGRSADFNGDEFVDFFDYDDYVAAFETGC